MRVTIESEMSTAENLILDFNKEIGASKSKRQEQPIPISKCKCGSRSPIEALLPNST